MSGLIRNCASTDLQVSRLSDNDRCRPWDQFLERGSQRFIKNVIVYNIVVATEERTVVCIDQQSVLVSTFRRSNLTVLCEAEPVFIHQRGTCRSWDCQPFASSLLIILLLRLQLVNKCLVSRVRWGLLQALVIAQSPKA